MLGLILKDLLNLRKELKVYVLFISIYIAITFVSKDVNILMAVVALMCVMMPLTAMAYDEKVNWDKYLLTMPVSRKDIVLSKYFLGIGLSTVGLLITSMLSFIDNGLFNSVINMPIIFWAISMVMLSIIMPIIIKYGSEKGRFIMVAVMVIPSVLIMVFGENISFGNISRIIDIIEKNAFIISIITAAFSLTLSAFLSLNLFKNKEI
ncbi:MAG: ABC-2 transporter permease [Peptostreptococcaceae bacterium]